LRSGILSPVITPDLAQLLHRHPGLKACEADLQCALEMLTIAFAAGNKLLVCGNGGSAADCEHMVGELLKGFLQPRRIGAAETAKLEQSAGPAGLELAAKLQAALPAISLVSQTSIITAVSNDIGGDMIFAQQVYGLGKPNDVLLGISTSGNSANVRNAIVVAKAFGLKVLVLTGRSGGAIAPLADVTIRIPADTVLEIQELHLPVYHWLCVAVESRFFGTAES
jgi:D-sedoheptulose 7-phosphate isomerase